MLLQIRIKLVRWSKSLLILNSRARLVHPPKETGLLSQPRLPRATTIPSNGGRAAKQSRKQWRRAGGAGPSSSHFTQESICFFSGRYGERSGVRLLPSSPHVGGNIRKENKCTLLDTSMTVPLSVMSHPIREVLCPLGAQVPTHHEPVQTAYSSSGSGKNLPSHWAGPGSQPRLAASLNGPLSQNKRVGAEGMG